MAIQVPGQVKNQETIARRSAMKVRFERKNLNGLEISPLALSMYNDTYDRHNDSENKDYRGNMISVGHEAIVYAMNISGPCAKFYIREPKTNSITHFPAPCFKILDNRVSRYWNIRRELLPKRDGVFPLEPREYTTFAIKEWIEEPRFLEFLVDEKEREIKIMNKMAALMDREFDDK